VGDQKSVERLVDVVVVGVAAEADGGQPRLRQENGLAGHQRVKDVSLLAGPAERQQLEVELESI
jgi:hypothetical protein